VLVVAATLIMAIVLRSVRRSLGGDLEVALGHALRIASGDLAGEISTRGERGSLLASLQEMQSRLIDDQTSPDRRGKRRHRR
jgi:methyl-accepting chemotaxis protein